MFESLSKTLEDRRRAEEFGILVSSRMYQRFVNLLLEFINNEPRERLLEIYGGQEDELSADIQFLCKFERIKKPKPFGLGPDFMALLRGSNIKGTPQANVKDKDMYKRMMSYRESFKTINEKELIQGYPSARDDKDKLITFDRMMEIYAVFAPYVFVNRK